MRRKILIGAVCALTAFSMIGCSNSKGQDETNNTVENQGEVNNEKTEPETETEKADSALISMREQGNPLEVNLSEIAEEGADTYNAWLKISTAYDDTLSMYSVDSIAAGTKAVVVDFTVSGMDIDEAVLYWCYEITYDGNTISLWDDSSAADKLTITGDGTYRMVFDANKALGGDIESVGSLQIVFPGFDDLTETKVTVLSAGCLGQDAVVDDYVTGEVK